MLEAFPQLSYFGICNLHIYLFFIFFLLEEVKHEDFYFTYPTDFILHFCA